MRPAAALACALAAALALAGCTEVRRTAPERAAGEQLLLSTAADEAADKLDFAFAADRAVYLRTTHFESYDKSYAIGRIREALLRQGARLVDSRDGAELIVEIRSGALSTTRESLLLGIPALEVPVPTTESVALPEIALFKKADRTGIAKFAAVAMTADEGRMVAASGPVYGLSWLDRGSIAGIGWRDDNVVPDDVPTDPPAAPDGETSSEETPRENRFLREPGGVGS